MEYYLTLKRNEILIHTTTWINLGSTMLSDINDTKGPMLYDSVYIKVHNKNIHRDRIQISDCLYLEKIEELQHSS